MEQRYIYRHLLNTLSGSLYIAICIRVLYENLDADLLMARDYIFAIPSLLLLFSFVRKVIKDNPRHCYYIKSVWSVLACTLLIILSIKEINAYYYLIYVVTMSFIPLITNPHKVNYQNRCLKNKPNLVASCGNLDTVGDILRVVIGFIVLYAPFPVISLLVILLCLEAIEAFIDIELTNTIFNSNFEKAPL